MRGETDGIRYFCGVEADGYCYVAHEGPPEFVSGGFEVASVEALAEASRTIAGASDVLPPPGPQGGSYVELRDPDGFRIDLVAGREPPPSLPETDATIVNFGGRKQRFGQFQRFERLSARVRRLGHFGLNVGGFARTLARYRDKLGMTASDTVHAGFGEGDFAAFMRVSRDEEWVDHHSVFFLEPPTTHVHHCSFEGVDPDEVMMGNEWLKARGWMSFRGVGRHILGSQVFDHWRDCSGFVIEH